MSIFLPKESQMAFFFNTSECLPFKRSPVGIYEKKGISTEVSAMPIFAFQKRQNHFCRDKTTFRGNKTNFFV